MMAHKHLLEALDRSLKKITNINLPFGGKTIVLCGDPKQLVPITQPSRRSTIVNATIMKSKLWKHFITKELNKNFQVTRIINLL